MQRFKDAFLWLGDTYARVQQLQRHYSYNLLDAEKML